MPRAMAMFQTSTSPARAFQGGVGGGQAVDRGDVHRQPAAGGQPLVAGGEHLGDVPAGAADEHGVGVGQAGQDLGGPPGDRADVRHAERLGVGLDQRQVARLGLDGVDHPLVGQLAASIATEPEPAPMSQTMLVGRTSSCARAIDRTSACVISPRFGWLWAKASSGLPNRR